MDDLYLDNIDEFVNDHNKIVTYKWLSLTLGVHVNTAKQMLYHYLDHKRKESSAQVHATYLVSGKLVDNGQTGHRVSVVREDQLEDVKSRMSPIVSVHIYSVQKALLKDSGPLYSVDYDAVKDNLQNCSSRYGAVRCSSAVPMSSLELQQARGARQALPPEPEQKKSSANTDTNVVSKPPSKPQKGIMGMFASKAAPKAQESSRDNKSEQEEAARVDPVQSKPARKPNPGANFFRVQTSKKAAEEKTSSSPPPAEQNLLPSKPQTKQEAAAVEAPKDAKRESRSKTKRVESDSEEDKTEKKKRRRIKKPDPDSSDEDVIPDSPPRMETRRLSPSPEKEIPPVTRSQCGNIEGKVRKRRRVLKSRAFVDDEGCIVTEKGYESESYSETEDDVQATRQAGKDPVPAKPAVSNKQEDKKGHKKSSANANKGAKQASIMGFFQKK
ncbi:DNA polymerase delta subunit 3 isoform X1 [Takifugu flavidus]|uniref:DNA polymerase delta subunit 3 isoform X1 n=2 Tax=Takifugu flavidus TaxID=433684 RepID=UPI0025445A6F|nr:DNA polymerase delta subunit 3 isoform X1 [Takifugu flavidus]